ncbi:hypothetical protein [Streptomyces sp. NBC_01314]|uniref:hypothetical protein n=1 Tax=Streptomyces sp. NBC_01314 TaxID=2903821 RepID=UPI00308F1CA4|nr:hypothetical protein OG622_26715 [Streptomyces sp. NBC_01314]
MSGVGYETNPELIKEFDLRAMFRRYRIVFCRCSDSVPTVFCQAFRDAFPRLFPRLFLRLFPRLIDFPYRPTFRGGNPGRGGGEFDGGYVNAGQACG